eukprot:m.142207 g.142207  ORF g.142207 m.142207 type:complete len:92 (+) comp14052_c0_seq1:2807-3082(+)
MTSYFLTRMEPLSVRVMQAGARSQVFRSCVRCSSQQAQAEGESTSDEMPAWTETLTQPPKEASDYDQSEKRYWKKLNKQQIKQANKIAQQS